VAAGSTVDALIVVQQVDFEKKAVAKPEIRYYIPIKHR
jgi:hypothetical protein